MRGGMAPSTDDSELEGDGSPYKEARTLSTTSTPADEGGGEVLGSICCCRMLSYHPASFLLFLQLYHHRSTLLYPLVELNRLLLNLLYLNRGVKKQRILFSSMIVIRIHVCCVHLHEYTAAAACCSLCVLAACRGSCDRAPVRILCRSFWLFSTWERYNMTWYSMF